MARLTLSLFVFVAVTFFSVASVSAQGFGLIQNDYDRYVQLFKAGKEPNLSHHPTEGNGNWRKLYRDHNWKGYAEETEHREPLHAAQVLMGIYLTSFVDHELSYQIDSIVRYKAHFSPTLTERITLDRIANYIQSTPSPRLEALLSAQGMTFYSQDEIDRMQLLGRDIDIVARKRMVAGVPISQRHRAEMRSVTNLFHQDVKGWAATYYYMREKFLVLDDLADSFAFNWDETKREEELQKLMESDRIRRIADTRTRNLRATPAMSADPYGGGEGYLDEGGGLYGGGMDMGMGMGMGMDPSMGGGRGAPVGLSAEDIEKIKEEMPRTVAEEELSALEARHSAYRYIVGVYQGSEFHLETLRKIHRYYSNAAERGDPIAQYHLALFLRYLGDIMNEDRDQDGADNEVQEWLSKAELADWAKGRVGEVRSYFARESSEESRRSATRERRLETLKKVEEDKLAMIDEVLIKVSQSIGSSGSSGGGRNSGTAGGTGMGGPGTGQRGGRGGGSSSDL